MKRRLGPGCTSMPGSGRSFLRRLRSPFIMQSQVQQSHPPGGRGLCDVAAESSRPHVSGFWLHPLKQGERLRLATMLAGVGVSPWLSPLCTWPGFSEGGLQGG